MKIAILSMQHVQNFGSLLQAYALEKLLKKEGCEVKFISIEANEDDNRLIEGAVHAFPSESGRSRKLDKYFFNRLRGKIERKRENAIMNAFRNKFLDCNPNNNKEEYDLCIIGSDEVFNCMQPSPWGFTSQLYGNVPQADAVITYAASCGSTKIEDLPVAVKNRIEEVFRNIAAFSVRDQNTYDFVRVLSKRTDIHRNLDPVVITDFSKEISRSKPKVKLPDMYCIVYAYGNRIHSLQEISEITGFCKERELTPICIGMSQKWINRCYSMSPFELLWVFQHCSFAITDTFHGTIFSAKYAKRFAVIIRESNRNKLGDLVDTLGIRKHVLEGGKSLDEIFAVENDFDRMRKVEETARIETIDYIQFQLN